MGRKQSGIKTNAMRELDRAKIAYVVHTYEVDEADLSGVTVAQKIGKSCGEVYKSLVVCLQGLDERSSLPANVTDIRYGICLIPVNATLDCKRAAASFGAKAVSLLPLKELTPVTGYVRGGCTPLALKKPLRVVVHAEAQALQSFCISAGRRGVQVEVNPQALAEVVSASFADIILSS